MSSEPQNQPTEPPSTLAQALMAFLMIGILCGLWISPPKAPGGPSDGPVIAFAKKEPLVATWDQGEFRVYDAMTGRSIFKASIPFQRDPKLLALKPAWHRWPGISDFVDVQYQTWGQNESNARPAIDFWSDDKSMSVVHGAKESTIVHLPSGSFQSWVDREGKSIGEVRLVEVDDLIVAVQGRWNSHPLTLESMQNPWGPCTVLWACNPISFDREISEGQKKRAIERFKSPISNSWLNARHEFSASTLDLENDARLGLQSTESSYDASDAWLLGEGKAICGFEFNGGTDTFDHSTYWLIDKAKHQVTRLPWPFQPGETLEVTCADDRLPILVGTVTSPRAGRLETTKRQVVWNLATGALIDLPAEVTDVRAFGERVLLKYVDRVAWLDLHNGRQTSLVRFNKFLPPSKLFIVFAWLGGWCFLVRPKVEGDLTRRFGVLLMVFCAGAIAIERLGSFGFHSSWMGGLWMACASLLLQLIGMLCAFSLARNVSRVILGTGWAIAIVLGIAFWYAGNANVVERKLPAAGGFGPSTTSLRNSFRLNLTDPNADFVYQPDPTSATGGWGGEPWKGRVEFLKKVDAESANTESETSR